MNEFLNSNHDWCIQFFAYYFSTTYYTLFSQLCRNKIIFEIPPQRSKRIWLQKFKLFFASVDLLITSSPIIIMILLSKCQIKFLTTSSMQVDDVVIAGFSKEYLNQNKKKGDIVCLDKNYTLVVGSAQSPLHRKKNRSCKIIG